MKYRLLADTGERTYALIMRNGDGAVKEIAKFAREMNIDAARLTAVGAFNQVSLGYYDTAEQKYRTSLIDKQLEVLSFIGDVARKDDDSVVVHAHVVLGEPSFATLGGHLMEGSVNPTLEVMLVETPAHLRRRFDEKSGLALIEV